MAMLSIVVPEKEFYIEQTNEFVNFPGAKLQLEHSLISLHRWEQREHVPYLETEKTHEQVLAYIKDMTITKNVDPLIYHSLTEENMREITDYINNPMTATWFNDKDKRPGGDILTAEVIYYLMIRCGIPFECAKWHLASLLTLIRVCILKNQPEKKMSQKEIYEQNARLNRQRKEAMKKRKG